MFFMILKNKSGCGGKDSKDKMGDDLAADERNAASERRSPTRLEMFPNSNRAGSETGVPAQ
jgi:hypothetical protein